MAKAVTVRALMANGCPLTQISKPLATSLGITQTRSVYVVDALGMGNGSLKWEISLTPILVLHMLEGGQQKLVAVFPVINNDAWFSMIIGRDVWDQHFLDTASFVRSLDNENQPTPGPRYVPGDVFIGHNVRFAKVSELPTVNEFWEFPCFESESVSRLAVNKVTRELVAVVAESGGILRFTQVPEQLIQHLLIGEPLDRVFSAARLTCPSTEVDAFPDAVLLRAPIFRGTASD